MADMFLFFDGASRGNPGLAAWASVLLRKDKNTDTVVATTQGGLGKATNNVAEYTALLMGLRLARARFPTARLHVRGDSTLVLNQVFGTWKINNAALAALQVKCRAEVAHLTIASYEYVPRKLNYLADQLCNDVLDGKVDADLPALAEAGEAEYAEDAGDAGDAGDAEAGGADEEFEAAAEPPRKLTKYDTSLSSLTLDVMTCRLAVMNLEPAFAVDWGVLGPLMEGCPFSSVTRSEAGTSLVIPEASVSKVRQNADATLSKVEWGWRGVRVRGPLPFELVGILSGLTTVLANAGISLFTLSTFDTDYILVKVPKFAQALEAWRAAGVTVVGS